MAINNWQGTTDDWGTAGNWSDGVPNLSDQVYIPRSSSQGIQSSMNQTAVDLDLLLVEPGYSQNIGADGNELTISTDVLKFFGSG
ncbi:MAG: hypothetical protein ACYTEX_26930, partial [Planctomycetota bacterium]